MFALIAYRLGQGLATLVVLMVTVFLLVRLTGSPVDLYLPLDASAEMREALTARLGLDQPLWAQFATWLGEVLRLDFGTSLWQNRPAIELVATALPETLALGAITLALAFVGAVIIGSLAALKPHGIFDSLASALSLAGASIPDFWFALMAVMVFAVILGWLPTSGPGGPLHWVLPVLTLVLRPFGILVQVVRGAMIATLSQPYIRAARAKGALERRVLFRHALRNAMLPVITITGDLAAQFAGGVTVIETVFGWPGIGKLMIDAILQRDFAVLQAGVLVVATLIIVINIIIDLLYAAIDPRVRVS
ncbi:MAG: ABC transporter permease [Rhizobium sp.]|nr:ABC transporter permease [Rhizobium sp.]